MAGRTATFLTVILLTIVAIPLTSQATLNSGGIESSGELAMLPSAGLEAGDSVTFSDLTITNKDLADYLAESDNMLESLESIIEIGVKTMNSLKNSIERDFTKQTFETIAEEMKKNLSDYKQSKTDYVLV